MFEKMTIQEAVQYCHRHANEFKAENGERQFDCLVTAIKSGTIKPAELPSYGMDYDA